MEATRTRITWPPQENQVASSLNWLGEQGNDLLTPSCLFFLFVHFLLDGVGGVAGTGFCVLPPHPDSPSLFGLIWTPCPEILSPHRSMPIQSAVCRGGKAWVKDVNGP